MIIKFLQLTLLLFAFLSCTKQSSPQDLEANFKNPPIDAKPKTWMHAMSGNMSKEGLTKDLEAIEEVGLGGVLLFNVSANIPAGKVVYNSLEHHKMIKHAAEECERLGLTFGFHNCDGWSSSGGPWITPENSMKMLVYSETIVKGGASLELQLEQPFTRRDFYKDVAVLAYPSLASEKEDFNNKPIITSSDPNFKANLITDNNSLTESEIKGENPWVQFDFGKPYTIQSFFMEVKDRWGSAELLTSDDGVNFTLVKDLFKHKTVHHRLDFFDHFEPVTARYFRINLSRVTMIREVDLMATYTIGNLMPRIGLNRIDDDKLSNIGNPKDEMIIDPKSIINLSNYMDTKGRLKTTLPKGDYTIMRFGYTTNGLENAPSSVEGRGLECDKFSKEAIKSHYDAFITKAVQNLKGVKSMQYIEIDSYEMAMQNWTDNLDSIFTAKKGYDLVKFLPLFTGRFVESANVSNAVLGDFREVTCDLTTENYYGYFSELCHQDGLKTYFEPYGDGLINELDVAKMADINMGEFWPDRKVKMIGAAVSGSRIFGKNVVSAEAFTSIPKNNWKAHPGMAKTIGDSAWVQGINQFMLHRFAHQSNTHVKPGMTLDKWGFHFDRTNTWWFNAGEAWFKYMARGSYMLRQGVPVSDLLIFIGEGSPNAPFYRDDFEPNIPNETNFDNVNSDVLINGITIKENQLVLKNGATYKILVLKNCEKLSLKVIEKIHEIALAGVPIVGLESIEPSGYLVSETLKSTFEKLVSEVKSQPKTYVNFNWSHIFAENNITIDLDFIERNDMIYTHRKDVDTDIYFFYNRDKSVSTFECVFNIDGKIPELWNPVTGETKKLGQFTHKNGKTKAWINLEGEESVFVVFRESSKEINYVSLENGPKDKNTEFLLNEKNQLELVAKENGAYLVTFKSGEKMELDLKDMAQPYNINGSWEVEFLKDNDFEATLPFDELTDWKDHFNENIKYYSGTAIYRKTFNFDTKKTGKTERYILDLGKVSIAAEVILNGKNLGVLWIAPFIIDITKELKQGENTLEIKVTNQWTNHLIGDERFSATDGYDKTAISMPDWYINNETMPKSKRTTFTTAQFYNKNSRLLSAGLLGPVQIKNERMMLLKKQID
ncbi:Glycosyl hydrolases family 2, sugar binding domain [Lutibacter agarilyticus]|uniref:Glycosyl hydrolases family 2, sugar binding domain n=1 Tax=Lutibacter agarilyticus TaxID=1109740 RepID=A0A238Z100_9FLAO|nr:glycosyl hydrolase [Lutibacter agarilyticus]SNR77060.1 Glycosyl hydrolases family 2, sugar binding domain [Lutibacter agarilyticus]